MNKCIIAMLVEFTLVYSFWSHCLVLMVYIWNRLPMASLSNIIFYETFYKWKLDISYLRVWEYTTYAYIQQDKQNLLQPHAQKYVFIGYLTDYKN